jgi:hypothetical protein
MRDRTRSRGIYVPADHVERPSEHRPVVAAVAADLIARHPTDSGETVSYYARMARVTRQASAIARRCRAMHVIQVSWAPQTPASRPRSDAVSRREPA